MGYDEPGIVMDTKNILHQIFVEKIANPSLRFFLKKSPKIDILKNFKNLIFVISRV